MLGNKHIQKSDLAVLLVRQSDSKLWGPPAGGLQHIESGKQEPPRYAMSRELAEEAWLSLDVGYWEQQPTGIGLIDMQGNDYPWLGYIFRGRLIKSMKYSWPNYKPKFETDSWTFAGPKKIDKLIIGNQIYKPEINIPLLNWWISHRKESEARIFLQLQGGEKK